MEKNNKSFWPVFAGILCLIQLAASLMVFIMLVRVNLLPAVYVAGAAFLLLILLLVVFLMIYWGDASRKQEKITKGNIIRRVLGTILSVAVIICCIIGSSVLDKFMETVNAVTEIKKTATQEVCVYVLQNDPALTLQDAGDYTFGLCTSYNYENSQKTVLQINSDLDKEIKTSEFDDIFTMIDALLDGNCGAIILDSAYVDIVEEVENYEDFSEKIRALHLVEIEVETEQPAETEENTETAANAEETSDEDLLQAEGDSFVVYISGSDTRNKSLVRGNSDVNILAVVNPSSRKILLVSTPRDYYINISISPDNKDKLTHCGVYGPQCSMDTLGSLYGVNIDYYAQINFTGFETLIDALGGVDVYSDATFTNSSYSYTEGYNYMDGAKALAFARDRYSFSDGDRARGRHQMAVISAIVNKMTSSTALITNYSSIMDSLSGMFATDFPTAKIQELVKEQLENPSSWEISTYSVTGSDSSNYCYSLRNMKVYVMIPDQSTVDTASAMIKETLGQ